MGLGDRPLYHHAFFSLFLLSQFSLTAFAGPDDLGPQELATRCFQSIGNIRLSLDDPRRASLTSQQAALNLCDKLIDAPRLSNSGTIISGLAPISTNDAKEVVRRFQQFHESIFKSDKFSAVFEDSGKAKQLHDTGNPGAYFTYAFFKATPDYASAVTESSALHIIRANLDTSRYGTMRELAPSSKTVFEAYQEADHWADTTTSPTPSPLLLRGVDRGMMLGIRQTSSTDPSRFYGGVINQFQSPPGSAWDPIWGDSLGGGFMGDSAFLLLNLGLGEDVYSNGSMVLPRRWAKEVMTGALCRSGPYFGPDLPSALSTSDISSNSSSPPFRQSGECMKCHSTMDPMAMVLRNIKFKYHGKSNQPPAPADFIRCSVPNSSAPYCNSETNVGDIYPLIHRLKTSQMLSNASSFYWPVPSAGDPDFFRMKTLGRLSYKSAFNGGLIINENFNADLTGNAQLSDLGDKIKNKPDYYLCGAMRYFELLSGTRIEIKSDDLPNLPSSTGSYDVNLWNYLKNEAITFQSHRNPKTLLKSLIRSPQFISRSWGRKPASSSIQITSVTPSTGMTLGGTAITITGANFSNSTTVSLSGLPCAIVSQTSSQIICNTSSSPATGSVGVMVTKNGYTAVLPDGFTYVSPPTFTGLKPIFINKCIGCHQGPLGIPQYSPPGGLSFGDYDNSGNFVFAHSNLFVTGENFVVPPPGNPVASKIYIRTNPNLTPTSNPTIMPLGAVSPDDKLSPEERNSILLWIQSGALDN